MEYAPGARENACSKDPSGLISLLVSWSYVSIFRGTMISVGRALSFPYNLGDLVVSGRWTVWTREIERARSANHVAFSGGTRWHKSALPLDFEN